MKKALPKKIQFTTQKPTGVMKQRDDEALTNLMQDMKSVWKEAAGDLLRPRPEAIDALLKKVATPVQ